MALTTIPAAGAKVRGSVLSALITELRPVAALAASNTTVNNSAVVVNATGVSVPVEANAAYDFELELWYSTNTTADLRASWTYPTGLTMQYALVAGYTVAEALTVFEPYIESTIITLGGTGTVATFRGRITVGSTAGTLQLQFAQSVANASNTSVLAGTQLVLRRVS